jgi:hypothetical protein
MLLATRAKDGWDKTAATENYRGRGARVCRKTSQRRYAVLTIFLIFWSDHRVLRWVTYIDFLRAFRQKKSTAIGVPSEKLWPFYYRTSESAGTFE